MKRLRALSEFWFSKRADEARNLIAVAVSEGIGVGMVLNGQSVRGPSGLAGEFGHISIVEGGPAEMCLRQSWLLGGVCVQHSRRAFLQ